MKGLIFFAFGVALGMFLRNFLDIPLWLELVVIAGVAVILWGVTRKKESQQICE